MCDALDGVDTSEFNLLIMVARVSCINKLATNTIMGMWTELFGDLLSVAAQGGGQIRNFTADPNTEGVIPANPQGPAVAYPVGGGTLWQWDVANQIWV